MSALEDIHIERQRQIAMEGWSHAHDDTHDGGQMAKAAATYAWFGSMPDITREVAMLENNVTDMPAFRALWRWDLQWWKPKDRRRDLVRAGALIVAEIERLDRRGHT